MTWPEERGRFDPGAVLTTERLGLVPLTAGDADAMAPVLGDERLHEFIGGTPATPSGLRDDFARLAAGSSNPDVLWLNWIVRRRTDGQPLGTVQATVSCGDGRWIANVAWVIGVDWQNQGFASEAARALVAWLLEHGASRGRRAHPPRSSRVGGGREPGRARTDRRAGGRRAGLAKTAAGRVGGGPAGGPPFCSAIGYRCSGRLTRAA